MDLWFHQMVIGKIGIAEECDNITNVYFETDIIPPDYDERQTSLIKEAFRQLNAYLTGRLREYSLPLAPLGTYFMRDVWEKVRSVPYGRTESYKGIAIAIGNPKAVRAVGMANNKNPIPLFIPCHRIIGASGKLVGYRGGLTLKQRLLELEKQNGNI
jgi:methylated-DNA-[protein]-cysteine S-methyltransferase